MAFLKYAGKRLAALVPVLIGISLIAFLLGVFSPGDPVEQLFGESGQDAVDLQAIEEYREMLGLDQPIHVQYIRWMGRVLHGDLGESYLTRTGIYDELIRRLPATMQLALVSLFLTAFTGIVSGMLRARFRNGALDTTLGVAAAAMISIPGFWFAILLINLFVERLHVLPSSGFGTVRQMILPCIVLSCSSTGIISRLTRSSVLNEMEKPYVTCGRSTGAGEGDLVYRHTIRSTISPVIVQLGNYFGGILGGSVVIENIFAIPGIGKYVIDSIYGRDYPVVQAYVLWMGTIYVVLHFLIDLLCFFLNPKARVGVYE